MTGRSTAGRRLAVVLATALVGLLVAEGGLSLLAGRSLRELLAGGGQLGGGQSPRERRDPTDDDRATGARGLWRVHEDPLVGFTFRRNAELELLDSRVLTDDLGLRVRVGQQPAPDALRIVVLGDSVAFGWGVDDDQTLAHYLEGFLNEAAGPDGRPVVCRTVAVPGWNHRNALAFLRDHLDVLDPDVVLYMPINNDLANTYSVWETGHRRDAPDIATPDPWLRVSTDQTFFTAIELGQRLRDQGRQDETTVEDLGPLVLGADLSAESSRRYDENAASIAELDRLMTSRGGRLGLLQYTEGAYEWILWSRLTAAGVDVPILPLLAHVADEFTLDGDPHPSPETHRVFAAWIAEALLSRGWVQGDPGRIPSAPDAYLALRAQAYPPDVWQRRADESRRRLRQQLRPAIVASDGHGLYQVYGGLNPDGTARRHVLLLLDRQGDRLQLELAPLAERPDLYPLDVAVDVDGVAVQSLRVMADGTTTATIAVPPSPDGVPVEVRLRASRAVVTLYKGRTQLSAYRLLSARCES